MGIERRAKLRSLYGHIRWQGGSLFGCGVL
jgi:hypothetical protein